MELTGKQKEELQKLANDIEKEAELVMEDYKTSPSDDSGSSIHIHEDSPFLDEYIKGDSWKRVIKPRMFNQLLKGENDD
jgi:hypothetical protein